MQLFSIVFSKGFYTSIQCGSSTSIIPHCVFRSGTIKMSVQAMDEKQDISLLWPKGLKKSSLNILSKRTKFLQKGMGR